MQAKRVGRYINVTADPGELLPERGESPAVQFKAVLKKPAFFRLMRAIQAVAATSEDIAAMDAALDAAMEAVFECAFRTWTWLDENGKPLAPVSVETLINELTLDEQAWMLNAVSEVIGGSKN